MNHLDVKDRLFLTPITRDTLASKAAAAIQRYILHENLQRGDRLPGERELSEALAISRNALREALGILEDRGVIVRQVGRGTFVQDPASNRFPTTLVTSNRSTTNSPAVLREARWLIEVGALEFIVPNLTEADLAGLERLLTRYEQKVKEGRNAAKEDLDFHLTLLRAAQNEAIDYLTDIVIESFREDLFGRIGSLESIPEDQEGINDHRAILQALKRRDLAGAQAAMRHHFQHFIPEYASS